MSLAPGIYTDISPEDYHGDPCDQPSISASIATILVNQSPAHAYAAHPRLGGHRRAPTKEMDNGSLLHALLLNEPESISVVDASDWRTKLAKEARQAAREAGQLPVLKHQYDKAIDLAERLRGKFLQRGYDLREYDHEVTLVWDEKADDGTLVRCRGRVDALANPRALDLKSTTSAAPGSIAASFVKFGYAIQWAAYTSAIATLSPDLAGRAELDFLFFECAPPFAVTPCAPDGTMRELGESQWRRAINIWSHCLRSGEWPEYSAEDKALIPAPLWALRQELGEEAADLL